MKKRILTGITTTGTPHIGNYLGAIKPALELAKNYDESFYFLADYHAIIKNSKNIEVSESVKNVALAWLASGLDSNKSFFYRQSDIPEILELSWILYCVTAKGLMNRSHAYKSATSLNTDDEDKGITMGLFSYPVLMAADILMFNATHVPVGADQIQHIEMTRDVASRVHAKIGKDLFVLPEAKISETTQLIPGTDGEKMSKSKNNVIDIFLPEKALRKQIMGIATDSTPLEAPKDTESCNVFALYRLLAEPNQIEAMAQNYAQGGYGYGHAKQALFELIVDKFGPEREAFTQLVYDTKQLDELLAIGAAKAQKVASAVMGRVRAHLGY
jgi:tryptophanyl-tRNA synthetase